MLYSKKKAFIFFIIFILFTVIVYQKQASLQRRPAAIVTQEDLSGESCGKALLNVQWKQGEKKLIRFDRQLEESVTQAFKVCLSNYIKIKTISPRGNEEAAVEYLENVFSIIDIPHKRFYVPDLTRMGEGKRVNLVATLNAEKSSSFNWKSPAKRKSVILLNHMDVVNVIADQWESPELPWSGLIGPSKKHPEQEYIWGRGALDMKGIGITQLLSMWLIKQMDIKMKRDIHFLAVADEEAAGSGAIGAIQQMQEDGELYALRSASLVLNEGGGGIKNTPSPGFDLFLLATEEKGGAWLDLQEDDPIALLKDLYKAKLMSIDDRITRKDSRIRGHQCKISRIVTPQAKVNVVASKIVVDFTCRQGFQAEVLFKSVFSHNFKQVKTHVVQNGQNVEVTIETASASHGATGINESAVDAFVMGLYHLDILDIRKKKSWPSYFEYIETAATKALLKGLGKSSFLLSIVSRLSSIPLFRGLILKEVEHSFGLDGLFRTTCHFSAFNYNKDHSGKANALVDCRLLHTAIENKDSKNHAQDFINQLQRKINNRELKINLISGWNVSQSPITNKDFRMIKNTLNSIERKQQKDQDKKRDQRTIATPYLFPAGTDSTWFRNPFSAGVDHIESIPAYGFFPLYMTEELVATYHGSNERFPVNEINGTVERYLTVLSKIVQKRGETIIHRVTNNFKKLDVKKKENDIPQKSSQKMIRNLQEEYSDQIKVIPSFE